jgi:hypothetical protein
MGASRSGAASDRICVLMRIESMRACEAKFRAQVHEEKVSNRVVSNVMDNNPHGIS